jgi:lactoylglutathione lyase
MNPFGYVIVFVSNMDKSVAFYRDILGFSVKHQSHKWTEFSTGETTLALHLADAADHPHTHAKMPAGHCHIGLSVANINEFHTAIIGKGVKCIQPPKKEDVGSLAIYADPDGLPLSVSSEA